MSDTELNKIGKTIDDEDVTREEANDFDTAEAQKEPILKSTEEPASTAVTETTDDKGKKDAEDHRVTFTNKSQRTRLIIIGVGVGITFAAIILIIVIVALVKPWDREKEGDNENEFGLVLSPASKSFLRFSAGQLSTYESFTREINDNLSVYDVNRSGQYANCSNGAKPGPGQFCFFEKASLGNMCTAEQDFGFDEGRPCIFFTLKLKHNAVPVLLNYTDADNKGAAEALGARTSTTHVGLSCDGAEQIDRDNIGDDIQYFPPLGFPLAFFPASDNATYLAPAVFVQFNSLAPGIAVSVKCVAWARNFNGENSEGSEGNSDGGEGKSEGGEGNSEAGEGKSEGGEGKSEGGVGNSEGGEGNSEGGEGKSEGGDGNSEGSEGNHEGSEGDHEGSEDNDMYTVKFQILAD